jgi:outer membrane cobalamin receptor
VDRQLAGRAAGVQVVSGGGDVGTPARIRIRGVNSVSQNQSPLIVVDGVPFITGNFAAATNSNALGDINPNDIENIEVLWCRLSGPSSSCRCCFTRRWAS